MRMTRIMIATVGASILALTGCGGGSPAVTPATNTDDRNPGSAEIQLGIPSSSANLRNAAQRAATANAKFGSVTQSSNVASGTTTDSASARFSENQLTFSVTRSDGSVENFRPASQVLPDWDPLIPTSVDENTGSWTLLGERSGNSASIAFVAANWNQQATQTDWIAQGVWIKTGDLDNPSPQNIEIGTFVDGTELQSDADLSGVTGTGTYSARVEGIYVSTGGDDLNRGVFRSRLRLTADFATNTVDGCVGCDGVGLVLDEFDDETSSENYPYRFRLGQAAISDNGRIEDGAVTVETDVPGASISADGNRGSWSGQFSNRNANGRPRAVAGTLGSSFTIGEGNGAQNIVFVGSFLSPPESLGQ